MNRYFQKFLVFYVFFILLNFLLFKIGFTGLIIAIILDITIGLFLDKQYRDRQKIFEAIKEIGNGNFSYELSQNGMCFQNKEFCIAVINAGNVIEKAVEESVKNEKLKVSLITNVSHDLKTPLTSIINYVGLIKREKIDNPKVIKYLEVLENKSCKLKSLTENLVEASKISSGNIKVEICRIDLLELVKQSIGEFYDKFSEKKLSIILNSKESKYMIDADPSLMWRVIENLFGNACKYAMEGTKVIIDIKRKDDRISFSMKNISDNNILLENYELEERFTRGDESRNTEGYGLGLSIAKNLTKAQGGSFEVKTHGDLFKTKISFLSKEI